MKKALLAIVAAACVAMGLNGWFYASPATAATCGTPTTKTGSIAASPTDATWLITAKVYYSRCTTGYGAYAKVTQYDIRFDRQKGNCSGLEGWDANPNVLGGWNPGLREMYCNNDIRVHTIRWPAPSGLQVYATASADARCIGAIVEARRIGYWNMSRDLPSLCVI
jgi:hypothetical protein